MSFYVAFYTNDDRRKKTCVEFKDLEQAETFINRFEKMGGFLRFNADLYGHGVSTFRWLYGVTEKQIIKGRNSTKLFKTIME